MLFYQQFFKLLPKLKKNQFFFQKNPYVRREESFKAIYFFVLILVDAFLHFLTERKNVYWKPAYA